MPVVDPNVSYYQQVQQNLAPQQTGFSSIGPSFSDGSTQTAPTSVTGSIEAQNAPALAQQGLQYAGIQQQMGDLGPQLQLQGDYATQMAGYQLGGLGINAQQTGIQQQGTEQAYGITQQQQKLQQQALQQNYGIQQQQYGLQQQGMGQSYGTQQQQYGLQQAGMQQSYGTQEQQYGLQQQGLDIQAGQQALGFKNQMQGIIGGGAASGALNTQGSKQQQSTAQSQNAAATQQLGIEQQGLSLREKQSAGDYARSQQGLSLNEQQSAGDYSRAQQGLGLSEQGAAGQYGRSQQSLGLQEQLSAGDYARAQQNYGLIGQANGLAQQEVYTRLQSGLQQMGVGADPSSLVSQAGGVLSGQASGVGGTLSQAGLLGGLNALSGLG